MKLTVELDLDDEAFHGDPVEEMARFMVQAAIAIERNASRNGGDIVGGGKITTNDGIAVGTWEVA